MKHRFTKLAMFIVALLASVEVSAYDFEVDGIYYNITSASNLEVEVTFCELTDTYNNGVWLYANNTYQGDVIIPNTVNYNNRTYTVTGIGIAAFGGSYRSNGLGSTSSYSCSDFGCKVTSVTLPSSIVVIKENAFQGCGHITNISLPNAVKEINESAFCASGLYAITIPNNVETINSDVFNRCSNLSSVVIGKSVSSIGNGVFEKCPKLLEVFCLPTECPSGLSESVFSSAHEGCEIYVPSRDKYGFGIEYLTFTTNKYQYNGNTHNIEWSNNLKAYNCSIDVTQTEKNAGQYTAMLNATYSNGVDFEVEIPYFYEITKAPLSLYVNDAQREYGEENPAFTCNVSGFITGESLESIGAQPIFSCEATKSSNVGDYRIAASLDAPNYEITYRYGTLTIVKAPLTVTAKDMTKVYGNPNPQFELVYTGLRNDETVPNFVKRPTITTTADQTSSCGVYPINVGDGEATNYEINKYVVGNLTITKRDLTAKANDCEKMYGEENPEFSISYIGFVNSDDKSDLAKEPTLSCEAIQTSDAGTYPIKVTGGEDENYNFVYQDGTLTVKPLTIGFKNVYNTVEYKDESVVSSDENFFKYIPEIEGDYNPDDFWITMWVQDKDEDYLGEYVATISGGEYAGKYVNYDGPTEAGKYIFNLVSKGTNPNITAEPSRAYLTVKQTSYDLVWDDPSIITVEQGQTVDLGISYKADIMNQFNTEYDEGLIEVTSEDERTDNPHWMITGLKEGQTELSFSIKCLKNDWGYYNFYDSPTITKTINVVPATGIENVQVTNNNVSVSNGSIIVENVKGRVTVYSVSGAMVKSLDVDGGRTEITVPARGVYIVKIGGKAVKVRL